MPINNTISNNIYEKKVFYLNFWKKTSHANELCTSVIPTKPTYNFSPRIFILTAVENQMELEGTMFFG